MSTKTVSVSIRIPELVHSNLTKYKEDRKPHMSLNSIIVDAIQASVDTADAVSTGKTQFDASLIRQAQ